MVFNEIRNTTERWFMKNQNLIRTRFLQCMIFLFVILLLECAKEKPMPREEPSNGWAGSPDNPQAKPFDYFYMKSTGRASEKAIDKKNKTRMEVTCIDRATSYVKIDLSAYIVYRSGIANCNMCGCFGCLKNPEDFSKARISIVELAACVTDYPINPALFALVGEIKEKLDLKYTDCKPTASTIRNFTGSEWRECECTVYAHIPGGRKSVWEKCINLEKRFGIKN